MTTLLLTGATGLVGSRLLPRLVEDGLECRALVRGDAALPAGTTGVRGDWLTRARCVRRWKVSTRWSTWPRCSVRRTRARSGVRTATTPAT